MRRKFSILCLLTCFSGTLTAAPVLTNVTGTLTDGATVSISGTGFGAQGPTIRVYDNFEGGTPGNPVDLTAVVGTWFGLGPRPPRFDTTGNSGNLSISMHDTGVTASQALENILKASFPATQEFYLSYWLQIPVGFTFPGTDVPGKIPTRAIHPAPIALSTWKSVWIFDGDNQTADNDIAMPTHVGGELLLVGNNTREIGSRIRLTNPVNTNVSQSDSIFRFGEWVRITVWLKAGADPVGPGNSKYTFEIPSSNISQTRTSTDPVFSNDLASDNPPYQWTHMNFTGFFGGGPDLSPDCAGATIGWCKTRVLFDDVYLATDAGAQARIEICDTPVYGDCDRFGYITVSNPVNWTDTTISGEIRKGSLTDAEVERAFAYVYDKDGLVNTTGFPLCPNCAQPPTNLQAE
jgi:hypothetical protein